MKNLIIIALIILGGYQAWNTFGRSVAPLYNESYVAIYGRDSCSITQRMISDMQQQGVNYHYFSVDDKHIANSLHSRMEESGLSTRRYHLPVVDVNGKLSIRPQAGDVITEYTTKL